MSCRSFEFVEHVPTMYSQIHNYTRKSCVPTLDLFYFDYILSPVQKCHLENITDISNLESNSISWNIVFDCIRFVTGIIGDPKVALYGSYQTSTVSLFTDRCYTVAYSLNNEIKLLLARIGCRLTGKVGFILIFKFKTFTIPVRKSILVQMISIKYNK